jgi:hypothetical protein
MIKLSQRDITNLAQEFIDNNSEFIDADVKKLFFTAHNMKRGARRVIMDFLAKEILGKSATEAELEMRENLPALDAFNQKVAKLEEVYGDHIKSTIEKIITEKFAESFLANTQVNKDAIAVIQAKLAGLK